MRQSLSLAAHPLPQKIRKDDRAEYASQFYLMGYKIIDMSELSKKSKNTLPTYNIF